MLRRLFFGWVGHCHVAPWSEDQWWTCTDRQRRHSSPYDSQRTVIISAALKWFIWFCCNSLQVHSGLNCSLLSVRLIITWSQAAFCCRGTLTFSSSLAFVDKFGSITIRQSMMTASSVLLSTHHLLDAMHAEWESPCNGKEYQSQWSSTTCNRLILWYRDTSVSVHGQ